MPASATTLVFAGFRTDQTEAHHLSGEELARPRDEPGLDQGVV